MYRKLSDKIHQVGRESPFSSYVEKMPLLIRDRTLPGPRKLKDEIPLKCLNENKSIKLVKLSINHERNINIFQVL